ncbi:hypothetical protein CerSpe_138890 [Prunus speciosa]
MHPRVECTTTALVKRASYAKLSSIAINLKAASAFLSWKSARLSKRSRKLKMGSHNKTPEDFIEVESLFKCLTLVQEMMVNEGYESMLDTLSCTTRTIMSVVDRQLTKSDQSQNTYTSSTIIAEKKDSKRRRLNGTFCSENRFRLSHHFRKC